MRCSFVVGIVALIVVPAWAGEGQSGEPGLPPPVADEVIPIEFQTQNGWQYDGRIELPLAERRGDWAVLMLGGGLGSSIDWLVPGVLTIDGNPTRDADTIARALLDEGFIVMRWHAIRRDDSLHAKDPLMMAAGTLPQTIEQAKLAFEAFQKKGVVPDEHIFLLGHSLGAYRAFVLFEDHPRLAGVVMLAGASLIPSDLDGARDVIDKATKEWTDAKPSERSGDSLHESSVHRLRQSYAQWRKDIAGVRDRWGHRWPVDLAAENRTPTLLLVGSLDERWLTESYLFTVYLRDHQHPDYTWKVFEQLGHNLAREQAGAVTYKDQGEIASSRTGPLDPAVVKEITEWLKNRRR